MAGTSTSSLTLSGQSNLPFTTGTLNASGMGQLVPMQLQMQLAQQQVIIAQQQQMLQEMAWRQQQLEAALAGQSLPQAPMVRGNGGLLADVPHAPRASFADLANGVGAPSDSRERSSPRREQMRQQNAEQALLVANRASENGRLSVAERYYRRVMHIVGPDGDLGQQAAAGLRQISSQ